MTNLFSSDLSFSGLPCTIKLLRSKHTEISMWLARPFISIFCRSACGIKRWLNSLQSLMNLESWSLNFILIYFLPSTPCSSKPSPFVRFPHQNPVRIFQVPTTCHMPSPPQLVTIMSFGMEYKSCISFLCSFLQSSFTSSLLAPDILLSTIFSHNLSTINHVSHPYTRTGKIIYMYILIFMFLGIRGKDKRFWTE